ncbi:MAG TPA: glycosyltransferase [Oscillospiraceae bacterium]|nr:glycosyltransferase [Oscillospiraceae bacterium]
MKKNILVVAHGMELGGIERSLIDLLRLFDYERYNLDLLLFKHGGELFKQIPESCILLPKDDGLASFQKSIKELFLTKKINFAILRLLAKISIFFNPTVRKREEGKQVGASLQQKYWDYSIRHLDEIKKEYDAVFSFMWPHHFVAHKVKAKFKIAWLHTDYSIVEVDRKNDEAVWAHFDKIACVSDECKKVFDAIYPSLESKTITVENVLSAVFLKEQADAFIPREMASDESIKLLSVGRFCYQKAFDFAALVCKELLNTYPALKWYLIGYGTEEKKLKDLLKKLGIENSFIILGKKDNPYPYMKACDIYVQASRNEGKAVAVREAQILGKPVLITNFKTAASQVKNGYDGLISDMDVSSVKKDIKKLIEDEVLRRSLAKNMEDSDYENRASLNILYELLEGVK